MPVLALVRAELQAAVLVVGSSAVDWRSAPAWIVEPRVRPVYPEGQQFSHHAKMKKQRSPGPAAYNIRSTVCLDAPAYSFGTMKRPAPNFKGISPGPVYQLKASLGRNKDQTFKSMPAFGFGTSERPDPAGNSKLRELPLASVVVWCGLSRAFWR